MLIYFLALARSEVKITLREGLSWIICPGFESNVLTDDWTVGNLHELVNSISQKYSIEASSLTNFFNVAKYSSKTGREFHRFSMDMPKFDQRSSLLQTTIIKITRSNGQYTVSARQAYAKGIFQFAINPFVWANPHFSRSESVTIYQGEFKQFSAQVLDKIYSYSENTIRGAVEQFKNI